jgi:hypothetical protein
MGRAVHETMGSAAGTAARRCWRSTRESRTSERLCEEALDMCVCFRGLQLLGSVTLLARLVVLHGKLQQLAALLHCEIPGRAHPEALSRNSRPMWFTPAATTVRRATCCRADTAASIWPPPSRTARTYQSSPRTLLSCIPQPLSLTPCRPNAAHPHHADGSVLARDDHPPPLGPSLFCCRLPR